MSHVAWSRLAVAAEALGELVSGAGSISLAEADDVLDEVAGIIDRTRLDIRLEVDRLTAMIGG